MIDFMVLGLPRSGTAWLANLLTTDTSLCLHESFMTTTIQELDELEKSQGHLLGICETSGLFIADEINNHPSQKVIIERPLHEINFSLARIGFPLMPDETIKLLKNLEGYRIAFEDLFDYQKISFVYEQLIGKQLNKDRHQLLCSFGIENIFAIHAVRSMLSEQHSTAWVD